MKKSAFLLLLLPLLAGCKESTDTPNPVESSKISLLGSVNSTVNTRGDGVIDPATLGFATKTLLLNFARINQDASTGEYPTGETSPYGNSTALNATRAAGTGSTAITFDPGNEQYYSAGATNNASKLVGWYPRTTVLEGALQFTIDGSTDIMLSNEVVGSSSALFSAVARAFTFNHLLTQLQFKVYAVDAAAETSLGTITSVKVRNQEAICNLTLPAQVSFGGEDILPVSGVTFPLTMGVGSANAVSAGYSMIAPVAASDYVSLEIVTSIGDTKIVNIPVPATGFLASNAYVITLSFSNNNPSVSGAASVGTWTSNTIADEVLIP